MENPPNNSIIVLYTGIDVGKITWKDIKIRVKTPIKSQKSAEYVFISYPDLGISFHLIIKKYMLIKINEKR